MRDSDADSEQPSYFHLYDDATIADNEGTDLIDVSAARDHAAGVARELTFKSSGMMEQGWSAWTMRVHDTHGKELFSLALSDYERGDSKCSKELCAGRGGHVSAMSLRQSSLSDRLRL